MREVLVQDGHLGRGMRVRRGRPPGQRAVHDGGHRQPDPRAWRPRGLSWPRFLPRPSPHGRTGASQRRPHAEPQSRYHDIRHCTLRIGASGRFSNCRTHDHCEAARQPTRTGLGYLPRLGDDRTSDPRRDDRHIQRVSPGLGRREFRAIERDDGMLLRI